MEFLYDAIIVYIKHSFSITKYVGIQTLFLISYDNHFQYSVISYFIRKGLCVKNTNNLYIYKYCLKRYAKLNATVVNTYCPNISDIKN